jgi:hypothetical protein
MLAPNDTPELFIRRSGKTGVKVDIRQVAVLFEIVIITAVAVTV